MSRVLVIGSANTDLVIRTSRLPAPGETLLGGDFFTAQGGKGANQAVAAARAGAQVTFIARVGQDDFGAQTRSGLDREGIDTTCVSTDPHRPSGVAFILLDERGENSIVVASGANAALLPEHIDRARAAFQKADICLLQLETPLDTVLCAAALAARHDVPVILNPAPAAELPPAIWPHLFLITPNETEIHHLTGIVPDTLENAEKAARALIDRGVQQVVITLGARGALYVSPQNAMHIPAPSVQAVDTTAAGDAFNGALARAIAGGQPLPQAVRFACAAGALTVTQKGAQPAIPKEFDILQLI